MTQAERQWDEEEQELLNAGKAEMPPPGAADGVLAALGLGLPPGPGGGEQAPVSGTGPVGSAPPAPAASGIFARPVVGIGVGVALLALIPAGIALSGSDDVEDASPAAVVEAAPAKGEAAPAVEAPAGSQPAVEQPVEPAAEEPAAEEASAAAMLNAPAKKSAASSDVTPVETAKAKRPSLAEELAVIKKARSQLNSGNLSGAEAALADHAQRFSPPRLSSEARVIRVEILLKRGQTAQAKQLAAPLMKENSPYRARMETLLSGK